VYLIQEADDNALADRAAGGDLTAFEALVLRHQRGLFRVALRMLGNYEDASDATQVAFVKAFESLHTFDQSFRFFSWLYRILLNECLNARRNRRASEPIPFDLAITASPLDQLEGAERRQRVQRAILALPPDYRQVLVLRHFGDLGYEEIAATLGIPSKTVKSRLYTARQRLTELLLDEQARRR
jgi:RNA polymerase sigma-70 factor (ECF subfamily)